MVRPHCAHEIRNAISCIKGVLVRSTHGRAGLSYEEMLKALHDVLIQLERIERAVNSCELT